MKISCEKICMVSKLSNCHAVLIGILFEWLRPENNYKTIIIHQKNE